MNRKLNLCIKLLMNFKSERALNKKMFQNRMTPPCLLDQQSHLLLMTPTHRKLTCPRCCLFPHRSPHMGPHHLPLCLISCGTHQLSLVSRVPLMGPRRPPPCLIWYGVHQYLMKIPPPVCLLNPLVPFANHRTCLHFGLVGKRQKPEIFWVLLEMCPVHLATSYTVHVQFV